MSEVPFLQVGDHGTPVVCAIDSSAPVARIGAPTIQITIRRTYTGASLISPLANEPGGRYGTVSDHESLRRHQPFVPTVTNIGSLPLNSGFSGSDEGIPFL